MLSYKKMISVFLVVMFALINTCAYANTYKDGKVVYGQYGDVWVFYIERDTNIKTNFTMNTPENGGPILDDEVGVWMPMLTMCADLGYEYKEDDCFSISNGLRTIKIPKNEQAVYIDDEKNEFEYKIMNGYLYFPYKYLDILFDLEVSWDGEKKCITLTERETTPVSDDELVFRREATTLYVFSDNNELHLELNEDEIVFEDAQPFIDDNDRTQVPIRTISEMLECTVDWDGNSKTAIIAAKNGDVIKLTIGSDIMTVNGKSVQMDAPAMLREGRTYIPIRFISEALGLTVKWL